ncbi:MAG TPA: helix-turn-helix transcriptional regulator [Stackebrandtia sp.]|jgi:transcriptional regulator with XRE-family HTH domain|uniref:helix-turn-helix domain-containing protein n=1 Tax=Stackebrandtia sp. TaxID=2023065 RepID=UPI002D3CCA69|nr:helix-turn-helix transcriptional regulator [Stackebrandtia sp.]HZE38281.1 helix-turn-helix transcriptional regulator [Stackebrandtia sp.]
MSSLGNPASTLAQRLRGLRESAWPEISLTQRDLARVLGGPRPLSVPLISSWENLNRPVIPPIERLLAYAAFFCTKRSVESRPYRILDESELSDAERRHRAALEHELLDVRAEASRGLETEARAAATAPEDALGGPWHFTDRKPITIVCAEVPAPQRDQLPTPDDRVRAYAELYSYAYLDSLFELHGHLRAANPTTTVTVRKVRSLVPQDYTTHLVLLGGAEWNQATRELMRRLQLPVRQLRSDQPDSRRDTMFQYTDDKGATVNANVTWADDERLLSDVGHFVRARNPFNLKRTVTICNGIDSRGVLGTVRALTDERFRERNGAYLNKRLAESDKFSVLTRVQLVEGGPLTPDWTIEATRIHEWNGRGVA